MGDSVKKYFEMNDTNDKVNTEINYVNTPLGVELI